MPPKKLYPKSTTRDISFFICETKKTTDTEGIQKSIYSIHLALSMSPL